MKRDKSIGIVLVLTLLAPAVLRADERVLSPGVHTLDLEEVHFLIERKTVDKCNACQETGERLKRELKACTEERDDGGRENAVGKWALWGGGVLAAFAVGFLAGR